MRALNCARDSATLRSRNASRRCSTTPKNCLETSPPPQVIAYAQDLGAWGDVVLVRLTGANTGSYVTAYGGGTASWQTANGLTTVTPTSGPSDIGPLAFRLIGIDGEYRSAFRCVRTDGSARSSGTASKRRRCSHLRTHRVLKKLRFRS